MGKHLLWEVSPERSGRFSQALGSPAPEMGLRKEIDGRRRQNLFLKDSWSPVVMAAAHHQPGDLCDKIINGIKHI